MIRLISFAFLCCGISLFLAINAETFFPSQPPEEEERKELWKGVQQNLEKGLPKSAIEKLEQLYAGAAKDQAWPEATLAICQKYFLEGQIDQPVAPNVIRKLQAEIGNAPAQIQPIMKTILAEWYHGYYQQNRWRFQQRSQTATAPSEDFETWDLARLLNEIDKNFSEALSASEELKKIKIDSYGMLISEGNMSDAHRPTLFDFVAFEALKFYSMDEQFIRQQGAYEVTADSPIFASVEQFLQWDPPTDDENSFILRAVRLNQEVLKFHQDDQDKTAFVDADILRLVFANTVAKGDADEKVARYQAGMKRIAEAHSKHPLSSHALSYLAGSLFAQNERVEALAVAETGKARFPESIGGRKCHNWIETIKSKSATATTERIWADEKNAVEVTYQNVDKVTFRMIKFDFANWSEWGNYNSPSNRNSRQFKQLLARPAAAEWTVDLPPTADYSPRTETIQVEADVKPGCYLLFTSYDGDFSQTQRNQINCAEVWVSTIGMVFRNQATNNTINGQIFDTVTGKPLAGATIRSKHWKYDGRNSKSIDLPSVTSDKNGLFAVSSSTRGRHKIDVSVGDQSFGKIINAYNGRYGGRSPFSQTVMFTDRSIYRPGQTIQFKGICLNVDQLKGKYETLPGKSLSVTLFDANNQKIETRKFTTNEFGSISGSFTAPRDRATGRMRLQVQPHNGNAFFRVEEYKRPKFYVEIDKPQEAFQLTQKVTVKGAAKAYTGAAIDDAKVVWRVVREVRYPSWYGYRYWYMPRSNNSQEIANGEMKTDSEGKFEVEFTAKPDLSVDRKFDPSFVYSVYADITDSNGETRSDSQSTRIGYTSLSADLTTNKWLTTDEPIELALNVATLDGEGQESNGTLTIFELTPPEKVQRPAFTNYNYNQNKKAKPDLSRISSWPTGEKQSEQEVGTDNTGKKKVQVTLKAGAYKAVYETTDPSGQKVTAEVPLLVIDPASDKFNVKIPQKYQIKTTSVEPGNDFVAMWGTGYDEGRAFVEFEHRGKVIESYWTKAGATQQLIKFPITEAYRGGLQIRMTYVRDNRLHQTNQQINVPWTNKALSIRWEHFVSKLQPGGRETWTAVVTGPNAEKATAEMVAGMYDASLDAFASHNWISKFNVFFRNFTRTSLSFGNENQYFNYVYSNWSPGHKSIQITYRHFNNAIGLTSFWANQYGWADGGFGGGGGGFAQTRFSNSVAEGAMGGAMADSAMPSPASAAPRGGRARMAMEKSADLKGDSRRQDNGLASGDPNGSKIDLANVSARKNLQETAFFFPHLTVDEKGEVRIEFEVPEALTRWKFMGFAHDNQLRSISLVDEMTTSKDLMVQPNPPRFLREGDILEFSVKVSNQSDDAQTGSVRLTFADARTAESVDQAFGNQTLDQSFEIPAKQSKSLYWKVKVPDFVGALTYKAVGATEKLSDGEEGFLPVLSKRILVTESLPLPIRGNTSKTFDFERLRLAGKSDTLQSQTLTLQMTSNPAWYAVMALPYLMEYPHECSEQTFNRLYANALGEHIINSDPKIERIFEQWRGTDALDSPLEKNEDLRNIMIAESPWLLAGKKESQARRDVGILFDKNRLTSEQRRALNKLVEMQKSDGAWPWFPGGRANDYITLYVTTGFGRLRQLGIDIDVSSAIKAVDRMDWWINERYQNILKHGNPELNHLDPSICLYLYGRSFFLKDREVNAKYKVAFDYWVGQAKKYWVELKNRQSQGHLAIGLKRIGDRVTPAEIMKSLTERSLQTDEMGMFWREGDLSWWWYKAPIETQALLIEAYDEVSGDMKKVEELKIWLLKQKQTQNWKTTKATADACYGLLLRGTDLLASDKLVNVKLGGLEIKPEKIEAGTGFYEQKFVRGEIKPEMGKVELTKTDDGIAWGSLHYQYLEDVSKIEPYEGTPLTLNKSLFIKKNSSKGPVIVPVEGAVEVGDELVMRIELRVDRAMEYVHLKDYRGSGTEPVNVLSRYKFQDGLAYYESTKDTASHFFIDYLPRGTYVFEYSVRVQHRGVYETGIAELQCMYAPEFNSHSGSVKITVE